MLTYKRMHFFDACTPYISEVHVLEKHALISKRLRYQENILKLNQRVK